MMRGSPLIWRFFTASITLDRWTNRSRNNTDSTMPRKLAPVLMSLMLLNFLAGRLPAAITSRSIAITGMQVPGMESGVTFSGALSPPVLNEAGQIAFRAGLQGPGIDNSNRAGLWRADSDGLELIVRTGQEFVNSNEIVRFTSHAFPVINASGHVAFSSELIDEAGQKVRGIFLNNGNHLEMVTRSQRHVPGLDPNVAYAGFFGPQLGDNNSLTVRAQILVNGVATQEEVVLHGPADRLIPIVAPGLPAPGTSAQFKSGVTLQSPSTNSDGDVVFVSWLQGDNVTDDNKFAVFHAQDGDVQLIVRSGDNVPGSATRFSAFGTVGAYKILANGEIGMFTSAGAALVDPSGELQILRSDATGPPAIGLASHLAIPTGTAIWAGALGELHEIAKKGNPAPGTDNVFNTLSPDLFGDMIAVNPLGQVAFLARVTGNGVTVQNERGLWATMLDGSLQKIARQGDLFEVAPGDFRRVTGIGATFANSEGGTSIFNARGELTFSLGFDDGTSGLFIASLNDGYLLGDTDDNGVVDISDLNTVRNNFGLAGHGIAGDTDRNNIVDIRDLINVRNFFGTTAPQPVPEPGAFVIAAVGLAGAVGCARCSRGRRPRPQTSVALLR